MFGRFFKYYALSKLMGGRRVGRRGLGCGCLGFVLVLVLLILLLRGCGALVDFGYSY